MKVPFKDLNPRQVSLAVAALEGWEVDTQAPYIARNKITGVLRHWKDLNYAKDWKLGGPVMDRMNTNIQRAINGKWGNWMVVIGASFEQVVWPKGLVANELGYAEHPTEMLMAAMLAYIDWSRAGEEDVFVPDAEASAIKAD